MGGGKGGGIIGTAALLPNGPVVTQPLATLTARELAGSQREAQDNQATLTTMMLHHALGLPHAPHQHTRAAERLQHKGTPVICSGFVPSSVSV